MNIKQFKRRWVNSKINTEMFYAPVQHKKINEVEPFIVIIEVLDNECFKQILYPNGSSASWAMFSSSSYPSYYGHFFYNLKNNNDEIITPKNYPDYFTDNPLDLDKVPNDLFLYKAPYIKIDWGDGIIDNFNSTTNTNIHEKSLFSKLGIVSYEFVNLNSSTSKSTKFIASNICHFYKKKGIYTIKVYSYGYADISISPIAVNENRAHIINNTISYNKNFKVLEVKQWGLYDRTSLLYCHTTCLTDNAILPLNTPWNKYKKIRSLQDFMYYDVPNELRDNIYLKVRDKKPFNNLWEYFGGDDFFHNFPKLINTVCSFWGYFQTRHIPDYCFSDNIYISYCSNTFSYNIINSIGHFIFPQNTQQTIDINNFVGGSYIFDGSKIDSAAIIDSIKNIGLLIIEDSAFENSNINSKSVFGLGLNFCLNNFTFDGKTISYSYINNLRAIRSKAFKNCKRLNSIYMSGCYFFEELGNECFANCNNLEEIVLNFESSVFHSWGKDTFKGCENLRSCRGTLSLSNGLLCKIPEKLFYDVKFNNKDWNFTLRRSNVKRVQLKKEDKNLPLDRFLDLGGYFYLIHAVLLQEFEPENYQKLIENQKTYPENYTVYIGKDMFNKEEVKKLHDYLVSKHTSSGQYYWIQNRFPENFFNEDVLLKVRESLPGDDLGGVSELYSINTGYAPNALWEVLKDKDKWIKNDTFFGVEQYVNFGLEWKAYSSVNSKRPVGYENKKDIPYRKVKRITSGTPWNNETKIEVLESDNFFAIGYHIQDDYSSN